MGFWREHWLDSPHVEFCGFSAPHPSEDLINIRIQTTGVAINAIVLEILAVCAVVCQGNIWLVAALNRRSDYCKTGAEEGSNGTEESLWARQEWIWGEGCGAYQWSQNSWWQAAFRIWARIKRWERLNERIGMDTLFRGKSKKACPDFYAAGCGIFSLWMKGFSFTGNLFHWQFHCQSSSFCKIC